MRLLFLGTGAAEGYPAIYCSCDHCERARRAGGRSLRRRSSLLVDDDLLIDLGPDATGAAMALGAPLHRLRTLLITHVHADHFHPGALGWRTPNFRRCELPELTVYGPPGIVAPIASLGDPTELALRAAAVGPLQEFSAHDARIWTFPAQHPTDGPLLYAVERGGAKFLYASDTGEFGEEVWQALAEHQFDAIAMEETMGDESSATHANLDDVAAHRARAQKEGILRPGGRFLATHISHRNPAGHEELEAVLRARGVEAAYDGMEVRL